jgi:drug/metabolite transporter (DMT)-like permease
LIAYLAFGEVADLWVWLGGGLIAAGAIYNARHETRPIKTQGPTPKAAQTEG